MNVSAKKALKSLITQKNGTGLSVLPNIYFLISSIEKKYRNRSVYLVYYSSLINLFNDYSEKIELSFLPR
jgi:hypothetical protein